ncbi:sulfur carrier protein ThiS [Pasteurella sp. PK-2025]|uniref:sulfur carrier protein ThiS n=1 Tax=unclassified Pasteurella TaxID=2621516 RepID=UPI003C77A917
MHIYFNDELQELDETLSVQQLIQRQQLNPQGLAVAINQQILPRTEWEHYRLQAGDRLTVFRAIAGG